MKASVLVDSKKFFSLISILFCLLLVTFLTSCSSQRTIVNDLDEKDANEILVYLSSKGINANKVQSASGGGGGSKIVVWNIVVQNEQATEAMALLNQVGLPRRRSESLLNIFGTVGLVPSEMENKVRYQAGLAEQIASTIRKIDGVLDADVQISFPKENPLTGKPEGKITAAVWVKHNGVLDDANLHLSSKIKRLVASSVTGLSFDDVTVIGDRARSGDLLPGGANFSTQQEKQYENVWSIIIAKESIFRFRILFFTFTILILILVLALIWIGWKIYPLLKNIGGIKQLFDRHPISIDKLLDSQQMEINLEKGQTTTPTVEKKDDKKKDEEGTAGKDIDET